MSKGNCLICKKPLVYFDEAKPVTCAFCGTKETGHCICEDEHYICDACHRSNGVNFIIDVCKNSNETDPIKLAKTIMEDESIYPNGPEHHVLAGAVLLTAYKNAGGDIDLDAALSEIKNRSMQVPGGSCGYWGVCGAAISAGQFYSIITNSTPLSPKPWADCARLTSKILERLADIGGPRCCKRTSFVAIEEAGRYTAETTGVQIDIPDKIQCTFMDGNAQCKRQSCPYFSIVISKQEASIQ